MNIYESKHLPLPDRINSEKAKLLREKMYIPNFSYYYANREQIIYNKKWIQEKRVSGYWDIDDILRKKGLWVE